MIKLTEATVNGYHVSLWDAAEKQYGSMSKVPDEEIWRISELVRGLHVLEVWQRQGSVGSAVRFLRRYDLPQRAIDVLALEYVGIEVEELEQEQAQPVKRAYKWKALEEWAKQNTYAEVTTEQVVELSGFSHATVLNYIKTSPYFKKIQRGSWEVRDPKEDRVSAKNGAA
jgi:hypothetical protein